MKPSLKLFLTLACTLPLLLFIGGQLPSVIRYITNPSPSLPLIKVHSSVSADYRPRHDGHPPLDAQYHLGIPYKMYHPGARHWVGSIYLPDGTIWSPVFHNQAEIAETLTQTKIQHYLKTGKKE
jgi:hypothetical protein